MAEAAGHAGTGLDHLRRPCQALQAAWTRDLRQISIRRSQLIARECGQIGANRGTPYLFSDFRRPRISYFSIPLKRGEIIGEEILDFSRRIQGTSLPIYAR